jgi:hypothetical protein
VSVSKEYVASIYRVDDRGEGASSSKSRFMSQILDAAVAS